MHSRSHPSISDLCQNQLSYTTTRFSLKKCRLFSCYQSPHLIGAGETPAVHEVIIRPINTKLKILCDKKPVQAKAATFIQLGIQSHTELPNAFDWRNPADLKRYKGITSPKRYLTPVQDQGACGSCWSVATATCFGDRYAIANDQDNVLLSATTILACVPDASDVLDSECASGGYISPAADFAVVHGIPADSVQPYSSWCAPKDVIEECQKKLPDCDKIPANFVYKGRPYPNGQTSVSLQTLADIKAEILENGPVVCCFTVFKDFLRSSTPDQWHETRNVYVNSPEIVPYGSSEDSVQNVGGHACVVIGFGIEKDSSKIRRRPLLDRQEHVVEVLVGRRRVL